MLSQGPGVLLGSRPELSWKQPCSDSVTPSITLAWLQDPRWQKTEFTPHLFSALLGGGWSKKPLGIMVPESPWGIHCANGDLEVRSFLRSTAGERGRGRDWRRIHAAPTFHCLLVPVFAPLLVGEGQTPSPSLGLAPSVERSATCCLGPSSLDQPDACCWAPGSGLLRCMG